MSTIGAIVVIIVICLIINAILKLVWHEIKTTFWVIALIIFLIIIFKESC